MANGHLGTRSAVPGQIILGWQLSYEEIALALGSPLLYYRFEEYVGCTTAADLTGARPGVYNGTVTLGQIGPSGIVSAALFASGAYLSSPNTLPAPTGTIHFWCKLPALPTGTLYLFGSADGTNTDRVFSIDSTGTVSFKINGVTLTASGFTANRYHMIGATYDGTTATLYVDGASRATASTGNATTNPANFYIGYGNGAAGNTPFYFDELGIWNGQIATANQMNTLYNAGISGLTKTNARVTQSAIEVASAKKPAARITGSKVEVASNRTPNARVTNIALEVVRQVTVQDEGYLSQTLSFTQTASAVVASKKYSVNQTLAFTQTTIVTHVQNRSLSQTLTFAQSTSAVVSRSRTTNQTLTFAQTVNKAVTRSQTVTQTFALNQSVNTSAIHSASVTQSLAFTSNATGRVSPDKQLSQTLTFTQSTVANIVKRQLVSQVLAFNSSASVINARQKPQQTLIFTQTVNRQLIRACKITDVFVLNQTLNRVAVHKATINQTLSFTQSSRVPQTFTQIVNQSLGLNQQSIGYVQRLTTNTLTFNQTVRINRVVSVELVDYLFYYETLPHSVPVSARDSLIFQQSVQFGMVPSPLCDSGVLGTTGLGTFTLGTECGSGGPNGSASQTLAYLQLLNVSTIHYRAVRQTLGFAQQYVRGPSLHNQVVVQTLGFGEFSVKKPISINGKTIIEYPQAVATATLVQSLVVLQSQKGVITLPAPLFDDSAEDTNAINVMKAMSRKTFSYIKRSSIEKLSYSFEVGRLKGYEFRAFYFNNVDDIILLYNWKGELFVGKFSNNPLNITTKGRYMNESEKVHFDIEFQGVKIHG